jgi:DNA-binding Lrp family transcriptional regulator
MVNQQAGQANLEMIRIVNILSALSDDKAFTIYNTIILNDREDFRALIKHMGITPPQYYSRLLKLTKAGLIRRENRKYMTTYLGIVVYKAISLVDTGLEYYWVLKVIESLQAQLPFNSNELVSNLVDSLIDDHDIKKILMDSPITSTALMYSNLQQRPHSTMNHHQ